MESVKYSKALIRRNGYQYVALGVLCALPGLLILAAGALWVGLALAWPISESSSALRRLIRLFGVHINSGSNLVQTLGLNGRAMTGFALAIMIAGLTWLVYACAKVARRANLYRKRNLLHYTTRPDLLIVEGPSVIFLLLMSDG